MGTAFAVTYDVFMRYMFGQPTSWAQDLSEYAMLWATFMAAPWVLQQDGHVKLELVVERLSPLNRDRAATVTAALSCFICAVLAWQSAEATWMFYARGDVIRREWALPQFYPYLIIPVGSVLLSVEFFRLAVGWIARVDSSQTLTTKEGGI